MTVRNLSGKKDRQERPARKTGEKDWQERVRSL
jgi:hypothetical protein